MKSEKVIQRTIVDGLKEAIAETEADRDSGDFPSSCGIGHALPAISHEERLLKLRERLAEAESDLDSLV